MHSRALRTTWPAPLAGLLVALVLCLGAGGCDSLDTSSGGSGYADDAAYSPEPLFERLGGEAPITAVVRATLERAIRRPELAGFFQDANLPQLESRLVAFLCSMTGGPEPYDGLDMRSAHAGMGISDKAFDALAVEMLAAMVNLGVPRRERLELLAYVDTTRVDIVERPRGVEDEVARLEARLAAVESRLAAVSAGAPAGSPAGPPAGPGGQQATGTRLRVVVPAPPLAKPATPSPWAEPTPMRTRAWTPQEKEYALEKLVARYSSGTGRTSEHHGEWLGRELGVTRMLSDKGGVIDLQDYRGSPVVIVILRGFKNQVCLYCTAQTIALTDNAQAFVDKGARLILVYPGAAESVPVFLEAVRDLRANTTPPFPIALDVDMKLVRSLNIEASLAKPTSIVLDGEGRVQYLFVGNVPANRPSADDLLREVERL